MAAAGGHTCTTVPVDLIHNLTVQLQNMHDVEHYSDDFLREISYQFVQCSENNGYDDPESFHGVFDNYALFSLLDCHYYGKCDGDIQFE